MASDTKERILEAALEMFSQNGYAGTNIRELSASLGLVKSGVYKHYESKEAIWNIFADTAAGLMLGEDYDRIAQSMTQGIGFFLPGFKGSPEEGLRLIVDRQLSPSVLGRSAYCERYRRSLRLRQGGL